MKGPPAVCTCPSREELARFRLGQLPIPRLETLAAAALASRAA